MCDVVVIDGVRLEARSGTTTAAALDQGRESVVDLAALATGSAGRSFAPSGMVRRQVSRAGHTTRARVLALTVHPVSAAATRFRVAELAPLLAREGIDLHLAPSLDEAAYRGLYGESPLWRKGLSAVVGALRQWRAALTSARWDAVLVQREAMLVGPPVLELLLAEVARLPMVFDFDDAIWIGKADASQHPLAARWLKAPWKTDVLLRRAAHVVAGAPALAEHARPLNDRVTVIPTVVSRASWTLGPQLERRGPPVVGWVGSHSTAAYLDLALPSLARLRAEGLEFRVRLVGAPADLRTPLDVEIVPWSLEREVEAFHDLDVGLGPVVDDAWGRGKCAFKQVQYFATGSACVTSPVGPARAFAERGAALAARTPEGWTRALRTLLLEPDTRAALRARARRLVEEELCSEVQGPRLAGVLRGVIEGARRADPARSPRCVG
ncbi:MAG: glycosyltransferase [Sandaracinaceae bacterium]